MPPTTYIHIEESLIRPPRVPLSVYLAANAPGVRERVARLMAVLAGETALCAFPARAKELPTRAVWATLRGMSEDRVAVLCEEFGTRLLARGLATHGLSAIADAKKAGQRVVLVSALLAPAVGPLAEHLGVDDVLANALEYDRGYVTGRLCEPVVTRHTDPSRG